MESKLNNMISQERPSRKRTKRSNQEEADVISTANTMKPSLPDLVIHRLLTQLLPTKDAHRMSFLSKQWEGVWSLSPVLDFDESTEVHDDDIIPEKKAEHRKFTDILQMYLDFRERDKTTQGLDRFRLRMTRYLYEDYSIVDNWLNFAYKRSVKEVDLSLQLGWHKLRRPNPEISWEKQVEYVYCLSPVSFFHAKSVTTLNLEFVRIENIYSAELRYARVLPCLKNMSLKSVYLDEQALDYLILECPSIECLSLDSCRFEYSEIIISSSSLKSLKVTLCDARSIEVTEAVNLEYVTFVSELGLSSAIFEKPLNLKYVSIRAQYLRRLVLEGCHDSLDATIDTLGLAEFQFAGFPSSKLYLKDPNLQTCVINLKDNYNGISHNFQVLRDFLESFDGAVDNMDLYISEWKLITFPVRFRETYSSPLPTLKEFRLNILHTPTKAKEISDLKDSLTWMVPSALVKYEYLKDEAQQNSRSKSGKYYASILLPGERSDGKLEPGLYTNSSVGKGNQNYETEEIKATPTLLNLEYAKDGNEQ
ncbi:putative F-box/LRR-repeat protein At3g44810 [Argentina anserina]|uniref:putative F-box/LRR-repeat protein At3g44810 n=1 Tax=Argentina anserina TaxID=57926 RepID=UPI0021765752|nr:putative F-box/LRR-repeat protein At3g44810 [Potentilla anserina]